MQQLILIAPAAFKGTMSPLQVAEALAEGARRALPDAAVLQLPISGGGDGLLDAGLPRGSWRGRITVAGLSGASGSGELRRVDAGPAICESAPGCWSALPSPG